MVHDHCPVLFSTIIDDIRLEQKLQLYYNGERRVKSVAFIYASEKFANFSKLFHFIYIHIYSMLPKKPWKYIYKLLWVFFTTKSNKDNKIEKTAVVDLSKPFPFSFQAINQLFFILARLFFLWK